MVLREDILTLRAIEQDDVPALQRNCWPERTHDEIRIRMAHTISPGQQRRAYGIVALLDNEPVGYGQLSRIGRRLEICNLIVSERHRSRGIGTAIILHLLGIARAEEVNEVEIGVAKNNARALELYQRLGFEHIRETKMYLGQVEPQTVYYLSIPLLTESK